ncbi:P-loop containing nucleoside triphosphate hydrolase protein, partial [Conidiobolus coronatus NRRL 28638]
SYLEPTKLQLKLITAIQTRKDCLLQADQGIEKSLSYSIPLVNNLIDNQFLGLNPKILIIVPLRGLAQQLSVLINELTKQLEIKCYTCFGGSSINQDREIINNGIDILIGTPGRIFELNQRNVLNLESIEVLIIDELDELFSLGFKSLILELMSKLNENLQIIVLSSTLGDEVENFVLDKLRDPVIAINDGDIEEEIRGFK